MIRDITIGQYYSKESVIHKLDPRTKLIGTFVYIAALFCFRSFIGFLLAGLFFFATVKLSKVPLSFVVKGLKPIVIFMVFTALLNLLQTPGEPLWTIWVFHITQEGIIKSIFMLLRLILLVIGSSIMTLTTTPKELTDGMETLFHPLNKIKIPVHELSMMMSIALRFIPILIEETDKIMKAQMARGADFETGNVFRRMKNMIPILVPLFVSAIRRAHELAYAMDARCYHGGQGRTKMKPLVYKKQDKVAFGIILLYVISIVGVIRWMPF